MMLLHHNEPHMSVGGGGVLRSKSFTDASSSERASSAIHVGLVSTLGTPRVTRRLPRSPFSSFKSKSYSLTSTATTPSASNTSLASCGSASPVPTPSSVPLRSKSLKETGKDQPVKLAKQRFSWHYSSGGEDADLEGDRKRESAESLQLSPSLHRDQVSLDVTFREVVQMASKVGQLDIKRANAGFKGSMYKTYWFALVEDKEVRMESATVSRTSVMYAFSKEKSCRARYAWNLTSGQCLVQRVSGDGKGSKRADKRTRYFQLTSAGSSSATTTTDVRQFAANSKDDADEWAGRLRMAIEMGNACRMRKLLDEMDGNNNSNSSANCTLLSSVMAASPDACCNLAEELIVPGFVSVLSASQTDLRG